MGIRKQAGEMGNHSTLLRSPYLDLRKSKVTEILQGERCCHHTGLCGGHPDGHILEGSRTESMEIAYEVRFQLSPVTGNDRS